MSLYNAYLKNKFGISSLMDAQCIYYWRTKQTLPYYLGRKLNKQGWRKKEVTNKKSNMTMKNCYYKLLRLKRYRITITLPNSTWVHNPSDWITKQKQEIILCLERLLKLSYGIKNCFQTLHEASNAISITQPARVFNQVINEFACKLLHVKEYILQKGCSADGSTLGPR